MNCFNHPDKPAVGFCKSCCRGLCLECAAAVENGLACKNSCEERVQAINRITDHVTDRYENRVASANTQVRASGVFILVLGAFLCALGAVPLIIDVSGDMRLYPVIMGVPFVLYGIFLLSKKRRFPTAK